MSEAPKSSALKPAGLPDRKTEDGAPVNIDAILQSILGRGGERFGMAAAVLRGERIIAQGVAGVRKRGTAERITYCCGSQSRAPGQNENCLCIRFALLLLIHRPCVI